VRHLDDYAAEKRALGIPHEQVRQTTSRIRTVLDACRFTLPRDIQATAVLEVLEELRQGRPAPELPGQEWFTPSDLARLLGVSRQAVTLLVRRHGWQKIGVGLGRARRFPRLVAESLLAVRSRGLGSQTIAYYWREMVSFCRWMAGPRQKRLLENPLGGVPGPDARSDPRHDRRALALDELLLLLKAARSSTWAYRGLTGTDRYFLYLTACTTGFRRKELSALTPASFDLDSHPPTVSLSGQRTKNKRAATQPLPAVVAEALADYLRDRTLDSPLWPRKALKEIVTALRHDLADAGIPYVVDGAEGPLYADLHSLRHSYVLLLDQAGVSVKQAMNLARHSDPKLTMARYGRPRLGDLASAVNRLPPLTGRAQEAIPARLRATGTDPNPPTPLAPPLTPLAPKLAPAGDSGRERLSLADHSATSDGRVVSPFVAGALRTNEGDREGMIAADEGSKNRSTPGDRRRASPGWGRVGAWWEGKSRPARPAAPPIRPRDGAEAVFSPLGLPSGQQGMSLAPGRPAPRGAGPLR
jgi:integrase